jgi:Phosphoesterase family
VNGSNTAADAAICNSKPTTLGSYQYRCGLGPRLPLLVISPWTRANTVSSNLLIPHFLPVILNPATGEVVSDGAQLEPRARPARPRPVTAGRGRSRCGVEAGCGRAHHRRSDKGF